LKKYEIITKDDFKTFYNKIGNYISHNETAGIPFKKMNITVKSWRKDKTSQQHKFYWVVISEMVKAFKNIGYEFTRDEVHEFVKKTHGHTRTVNFKGNSTITITRSIADDSDDVNIKVMMDLIDFSIRWTAINLDYVIEDPRRV